MFDWPELRADGPIFGSHCLVEEQLLQIKFDWPVRPATKSSSFDWPVRLDIESGSQQMTYIQWVHAEPLQLVQGTEQVLPTAMIRYMVVVLAR